MSSFLIVALILALPVIITLIYVPFAPVPLWKETWDNNNGYWTRTFIFSPIGFISTCATALWLIFCMGFRPIAKLFFYPDQMQLMGQSTNNTWPCQTCTFEVTCYKSPKDCGKYKMDRVTSYKEENNK